MNINSSINRSLDTVNNHNQAIKTLSKELILNKNG